MDTYAQEKPEFKERLTYFNVINSRFFNDKNRL